MLCWCQFSNKLDLVGLKWNFFMWLKYANGNKENCNFHFGQCMSLFLFLFKNFFYLNKYCAKPKLWIIFEILDYSILCNIQGRRNRWSQWSPGFTGIQRFYYREIFSILDLWKGKFFVLHRKKAHSFDFINIFNLNPSLT